jgi:hypothetical protein
MSPLLIVGGIALLLIFFKSQATAKVNCGDPPFCKPSYTPVTLGVAPEWNNAPDLNKRIRFFIDPTTGCMIQNSPSQLQRVVTYVTLLDPKQIETFRCVNGLRAPTSQAGLNTEALGGIGMADLGFTAADLAATQGGGGKTSEDGCCCTPAASSAVVAASAGTVRKYSAFGSTGTESSQPTPYIWSPILGYVPNPNYPS